MCGWLAGSLGIYVACWEQERDPYPTAPFHPHPLAPNNALRRGPGKPQVPCPHLLMQQACAKTLREVPETPEAPCPCQHKIHKRTTRQCTSHSMAFTTVHNNTRKTNSSTHAQSPVPKTHIPQPQHPHPIPPSPEGLTSGVCWIQESSMRRAYALAMGGSGVGLFSCVASASAEAALAVRQKGKGRA